MMGGRLTRRRHHGPRLRWGHARHVYDAVSPGRASPVESPPAQFEGRLLPRGISLRMRPLERDSHLEALSAWLERIPAAGGCAALVFGEAGIGKTALLRQFAASQQGAKGAVAPRIFWGGCEALFTPHPLAPL